MSTSLKKKYTRWLARKFMPEIPITKDLNRFRFGFFGEFAFSLSSWIPYLLFLKENGCSPIKTIGPCGSSPYYYFSDDHLELSVEPGACWGHAQTILHVQNNINEHLLSPCNERRRQLEVLGYKWLNTETHRNLKYENYCRLNFRTEKTHVPEIMKPHTNSSYYVVNVKTYFNHENNLIKTFYDHNDLLEISNFCKENNCSLLLNRFPDIEKNGNLFVDDSKILTDPVTSQPHVFDMRKVYSKLINLSECNMLQIKLLRNAKHVFATNGGNAFLSIILANQVSFMMQGGGDFAEYSFLSKVYNKPFTIAYTTRDLIKLIRHNIMSNSL